MTEDVIDQQKKNYLLQFSYKQSAHSERVIQVPNSRNYCGFPSSFI
jgi:hypothetical protein